MPNKGKKLAKNCKHAKTWEKNCTKFAKKTKWQTGKTDKNDKIWAKKIHKIDKKATDWKLIKKREKS